MILQLSSLLISVPGESLATAEEQPSPNVTVPVPMEDSNETGVIHVKDPDDVSEVARKHL